MPFEAEAPPLSSLPRVTSVPPAVAPVVPAAPPPPRVEVLLFEPRPRSPVPAEAVVPAAEPAPVAPAVDQSAFLVASAPRELERARRNLLDSWAQIDGDSLEASSTWAPVPGWTRIEPAPAPALSPPAAPPKGAPAPAPVARPMIDPKPPVFGGAAVERSPLAPKSALATPTPTPAPALTAEELVPVEGTEEPTPFVELPAPSPASTPPGVGPSPLPQQPPPPVAPPPAGVTLGKLHTPVPKPAPKPEDSFFDEEPKASAPASSDSLVPQVRSRALPLVILAGLVLGVGGTVALLARTEPTVVTVLDAGAPESDVVDAGEAVAEAPDASEEAPQDDAGALAEQPALEPHDAGALAVEAVKPDAGAAPIAVAPVAPVAIDAGQPAASPAASSAEIARLTEEAGGALAQQRYRAAIGLYRKLVKARPDAASRTGLGISLVMADVSYAEAIPYLKEGVRLDAGNADAWLALGIAYQNLGRDADAKAPYTEYLRLKPTGLHAKEVREALGFIH